MLAYPPSGTHGIIRSTQLAQTSVPAEESSASMSPPSSSEPRGGLTQSHRKRQRHELPNADENGHAGRDSAIDGWPSVSQFPLCDISECVRPTDLGSTCLRKAGAKPHICLFGTRRPRERTHIPRQNWLTTQ